MYANKEDALNDENVLDTQTTNENGIVTFKELPPYYGTCIKERQTLEGYQIRDKEKDIVSVYRDNGVRFLGEMTPTQLKPSEAKDGQNLNTYLQSLVDPNNGNFNGATNWLVFNDNGKEKLVAKKPIKFHIAWNSLYNAGLVFGEDGVKDLINADFTHSNYDSFYQERKLKDYGKGKGIPKTYKPTYVAVNGKKYIVRLIRTYDNKVGINDNHNWSQYSENYYNATKGSEWNRMLLPLIDPTDDENNTGYANGTNGRYGSNINSKKFVESNMPVIANYSWRTDFGGNNNISGNYNKGSYFGSYRWAQETGYDGSSFRTFRGSGGNDFGAGFATSTFPYDYHIFRGWLPVLELVN